VLVFLMTTSGMALCGARTILSLRSIALSEGHRPGMRSARCDAGRVNNINTNAVVGLERCLDV